MLLHLLLLLLLVAAVAADGDPQTNLLNLGCSQYNATDHPTFFSNLNATFSSLRSQLSSSPSLHFATAQQPRSADPVYALFQCRAYLSPSDCSSCLSAASARIRTCNAANGARVIYDGCFLRYESASFFDQPTLPGNVAICGNKTDTSPGFASAAGSLLKNLAAAAPKMTGYSVAAESGGAYGIAQCAETLSESGCDQCLQVAYGNIQQCPPDAEGRAVDAGCFMRYSSSAFFPANQTVDLSRFLASGGSSSKAGIIGGVVGGVGGFLLLLSLVLLLWIRHSRKTQKAHRGDILGATELRGPENFPYKDLKSATKNFSDKNKLGEGGFGDVYKGDLKNGKVVAVKRLTIAQTSRAKADFQGEVKLISNVHHRNLVRLLGCSSKGPDMLLVYEYMANSSLDKFLFGDKRGSLNWKQRFDIIVGIARGLAYLHHEFHICIIHRDIKSSNILLDDGFQAKIADFGLARLLPGDQTHVSTRFAGTLGYTAPEYAIHGKLSEKVDTYSFGVVVLEIISGRKSNDISLEPVNQYLLEWAWALYEMKSPTELVDSSLDPEEYDPEEVKRIIEIALLCTQSAVAARPTMSEVVVLLLSKGVPVPQPTMPTFIDAGSNIRGNTSSSTAATTTTTIDTTTGSSSSNATVSISQLSAR